LLSTGKKKSRKQKVFFFRFQQMKVGPQSSPQELAERAARRAVFRLVNNETRIVKKIIMIDYRYVGIYHAHLMPIIFTPVKSWLMVLGVWILSLGLMALPLSEIWGQMGYEPTTFSCTVLPKNDRSPMTFLVLVGMVFPCVVMIVCYR
jgi:hypothetical protein